MIQFTILVGPIPIWVNVTIFVAYCSHDLTHCPGELCWLFFADKPSNLVFWGQLASPPKKIVLRKGRRCLRWAQNEMRANRRITMNIIQPDDNLRSWCELTIDPPHRNWKNLAINASGPKSTRVGIEPWGFHQNGGYTLYCCCRIGHPLPKHCCNPHQKSVLPLLHLSPATRVSSLLKRQAPVKNGVPAKKRWVILFHMGHHI